MPASPNPSLAQKLRRLGLLDDDDRLPELDELFHERVQKTLLSEAGTRSAMRLWIDAGPNRQSLPTTALLVVLDHMREWPSECASILKSLAHLDFDQAIAKCALDTGRSLHEAGRTEYAKANMDISVNFLLEAQQEFLFAATSGRLSQGEVTEALGKYAVAVALASRWVRTDPSVLRQAYEFHLNSIAGGNTAPQAYEYLTEILIEVFNQSGDEADLDRALAISDEHGLRLQEATLLLKRGVLRRELQRDGSIPDLQRASQLAEHFPARTGVEYVQRALVHQFALSAILEPCPLRSRDIRLPFGFLLDLPGLPTDCLEALRRIVVNALTPMRESLRARKAPPNLVAQQVLAATLRAAVERSGFMDADAAGALVEITAEAARHAADRHLAWRHAEALLVRAQTSRRPDHVTEAAQAAQALITAFPMWPLPRVTLARARQLQADLLGGVGSVDEAVAAWTDATKLVVDCPEFRRSDLGGRSGVFAVEDARGDLSTALVFKPVASEASGLREAEQMRILASAISKAEVGDRFGVPLSLAVVPKPDGEFVHVMERQLGRVLSSMEATAAARHLPACAELLGIFHAACGPPPPDRSGWPTLKKGLTLWSKALFADPGAAAEFVEAFKAALPQGLPLVTKRDAHGGNWVIDAADRVIAIDLEGASFIPVSHDVAQLVEDGAFLPVDEAGFAQRSTLMRAYLPHAGIELDGEMLEAGYHWAALYRSVWLATSAGASKAQHSHARRLAHHIAATTSDAGLRSLALRTSSAIQAMSPPWFERGEVTASHRGLSRAMSRVLRHRAPELGLVPDEGGFVGLDALSSVLGEPIEALLAVAAHPAEPRFQILDHSIRALYGHSFPVTDLHEINVEVPETLYHGTSWDHLSSIVSEGLEPKSRQRIHLTNNPAEAIEVARRHGHAVLLAVTTSDVEDLRAVADAIWAATRARPSAVRVRNAFVEVANPPAWLSGSVLGGR